MKIVRFDHEVGMQVDRFGSDFVDVPVAGGQVSASVLYLPPGGGVGRHDAEVRHLFACVAGEGWAEDGDGNRVALRPGRAAIWDTGEPHAVTTETGMTAVVLAGELDVMAATLWRGPIVVDDHDPAWVEWFQRIHDHLWPAVRHLAIRIDHVGSTAVEGLPAKPIIDVDIVLPRWDDLPAVNEALEKIGYRWRGDLGVEGRHAYALVHDVDLPPHHLYCVVEGNRAHLDHVLLRDLLREDAEARRRYGDLKRRNAEVAHGDLDHYVKAKARLVAELLTRARAERGHEPVEYWDP